MNEELESFVEQGEDTVETTDESQVDDIESTDEVDESAQQDNPTGEEDAPPVSEAEPQLVPLAKAQAEKERRKKVEKELEETRLEMARLQGQQQVKKEPDDPKPDPYTDPEEFAQWNTRQQQKQASIQNQKVMKARINAAEEIARSELTDYDKYADYFAEHAKTNPDLIQNMMVSPDPARYAYYKGKAAMEKAETESQLSEYGSVEALKKAAVEEYLASQKTKPEVNVPPNMANARNAGGDSDDTISDGKDGLNALLGR